MGKPPTDLNTLIVIRDDRRFLGREDQFFGKPAIRDGPIPAGPGIAPPQNNKLHGLVLKKTSGNIG
ncbi:MAG: hypothetical protein CMJ81_21675 [Planctomycetaceae bacterium]|nr:hypothetical protein [Planctomycetaceae bacterium]MBP60844.1 hypothetical protein [Planctomycetaceae bacterium]